MITCGSVLEHIENLEQCVKEIRFVLKKNGKLIVGYPIETRLLEFIITLFMKSESKVWQQLEINKKKYSNNPHIHKQSYREIRKLLQKSFFILKKSKIPNNFFPDFFSIYENVVLVPK